MKKSAKI